MDAEEVGLEEEEAMRFEERTVTLKDGRTCVLKPNAPEYAEEMLEYLKKTSAETEFLLRYPDEVKFTLEQEREILGSLLDNPYVIMMIALVDGKPAGNGSIGGIGDKIAGDKRILHAGVTHRYTVADRDSGENYRVAARHSYAGFNSVNDFIDIHMSGHDLVI